MKRSNPSLPLTLAATDLTSSNGQKLFKAFPDYFCDKKRPSRHIPFSWIVYITKLNAKNNPDAPLDKEEVILHLVTWGAIDHFDIPYITLEHGGDNAVPSGLMKMHARPFSELIYKGARYLVIEDSTDEIYITECHYFKKIPHPFSCSHNDLCPL